MSKQLYRFCPPRSGHRIKIGRKTYLKDGQCMYLTTKEVDAMPRMRPVDPETGEFLDVEEVRPEPVVVIELPPEPVKEEDILTSDPVVEEPEPEVLEVPVVPKARKASRKRGNKAKK